MAWFATLRARNGIIAACGLALALAWPTAANAQDTGDAIYEPPPPAAEAKALGPLAPFLLYGPENDGPWTGQTDGNAYRLVNADDPDAITYFFLGTQPEAHGRRTIRAKTMVLQGDGKVGLLYGMQEQPKEYYLMVLDSAGLLQVFHRPPEGGLVEAFHAKLEGKPPAEGQPAAPLMVTLKLVEEGDTAKAFVDDVEIGTIQGPAVGKGGVGIAAVGLVDGLFLDFALDVSAE